MTGSATLTSDPSRKAMLEPSTDTTSVPRAEGRAIRWRASPRVERGVNRGAVVRLGDRRRRHAALPWDLHLGQGKRGATHDEQEEDGGAEEVQGREGKT